VLDRARPDRSESRHCSGWYAPDMELDLAPLPVPIRIEPNGAVRVGPTRVTLETVLWTYQNGETAEGIVACYPTLELADVHAVIAWYYRHREQADAYLTEVQRVGDELRAEIEANPRNAELRARLIKRRDQLVAERQA